MRMRNLVLIGIGIAIGYQVANKMRQDDTNIVRGPQRQTSAPGLQLVSSQAQRLADRASARSLEAIQRARGVIRDRLGESDDAAWN